MSTQAAREQILSWLADGDHINIYRKPTEFRTAKGNVILPKDDVRWLRHEYYVAEVRPGNLDITRSGRALLEFWRIERSGETRRV